MKSLVLLSALVSITIAVPTYIQHGGYTGGYTGGYNGGYGYLPQQAGEFQRYKKSTSQDLSPEPAPENEEAITHEGELAEERTFKLKKHPHHQEPHHHQVVHHHYPAHYHNKHPGHHFRENEDVEINAKQAIEEPSTDDQNKKITFTNQHRDMEKHIHIAKEAVDNIGTNFEEISKKTNGVVDWKNSESDKTFKQGLQTAKEALNLVHKSFNNFENVEAKDAITSPSNDASIKAVRETQEQQNHWKNAENIEPKNEKSLKGIENEEKQPQEKKLKEADDLSVPDMEGHMSERIETIVAPNAPMAPLNHEQEQKSAVMLSENIKYNIMPKSNKDADLQMKDAPNSHMAPLNHEQEQKSAVMLSENIKNNIMPKSNKDADLEMKAAPNAPMAPLNHEQEQKSAVMLSENIKNNIMPKSNKDADLEMKSTDMKMKSADMEMKSADMEMKSTDMKMKSADVSTPTSEIKNNLNVPPQNTESKTKFVSPKPKIDDINQQLPKARFENEPILQSEKLDEPKQLTQISDSALTDLKPTPKAAAPQSLHKFEVGKPMHDLKHHNHPEARGAYNIAGAGQAYGAISHPVGGAGQAYGSISHPIGGVGQAYGAIGHPAGGAASGHGSAIGLFPNANVGGCAIPLLLSCSPSVVPGSLAKYPGGSAGGSNYGPPAYRGNIDSRMIEKRNTKKQPFAKDISHTAILTQFQ